MSRAGRRAGWRPGRPGAEEVLKVLSNPVNLQILVLLAGGGFNTRQLSRILGRDETDISRRLSKLQKLGLVESRWVRAGERNIKMYTAVAHGINIDIETGELRVRDGSRPELVFTIHTKSLWSPPAPAGDFVGRKLYLEALDRLTEGHVMVITGLPGIGKTTLVTAWISLRNLENVLWHTFTESDHLEGLLRKIALFLASRGLSRLRDYIVYGDADLDTSLSIASEDLDRLGALVVLDDFHKSRDPRIAEFLHHLVVKSNIARYIVISREEPRLLGLGSKATYLELPPFRAEETHQLLEKLLGKKLEPRVAEHVHETLSGYPLLLKWLADLALIKNEDLGSLVGREKRLLEAPLVNELMSALGVEEKRVIFTLLCLGGHAPKDTLLELLGVSRGAWAISRLADKKLVMDTSERVILKETLQSILGDSMTGPQCRSAVERAVDLLLRGDGAEAFLEAFRIALTWPSAELFKRLVHHRIRRVTHRILDHIASYGLLLDKALKVAPTAESRALLLAEKTMVIQNTGGDPKEIISLAKRVLPVLEEIGDHLVAANVYARLVFVDLENAEKHARKAMWHAVKLQEPLVRNSILSQIHANLTYYYTTVKRDLKKAAEHVEMELEYAKLEGDEVSYWISVFHREMVQMMNGVKPDEDRIRTAREVIEHYGNLSLALTIATYETVAHMLYGEPAKAVETALPYIEKLLRGVLDKSRRTHLCNLLALYKLATLMSKTEEGEPDKIGKAEYECIKEPGMSCYYYLYASKVLKKKKQRTPGLAHACASYDLEFFKRFEDMIEQPPTRPGSTVR